ncbi:hypothetical protein EV182_002822 [Spiromyces aspiralis]|uniref:Uncharacterized protein n=1 Tax=Spiromyces aspiralis TaxID=68401 RepID=A0ACC1HDW7_9FUNG|nr:hypothetical protein EV182_002822 [Spiromyces aspiralis]
MYARPSFQAESCNSSVRSSTSTADPTASVSRSKSERDSDYHRSHRHYDKYHRPTTSRSNHQRPSPRHERHRQLKSTSGRKSSESTAEPFKLSKPLPGLPLPLDIITDPRLLKKKGKPASAGRRSGKRNTPSPRKDLTNITGITAQATGAEAASADAKSESDANSDTSAESKTLMSATSLTRVTPTIVTLDTIPQSPASSDGRASPSMRRKAERASALYKLTANQGVQGKRAKNELYRNKSMDRLHVESADLARRLDKEIRCRINMDKFRGCKVSRVSIIPFPASPPLSPLSMAAGNRSWRRRKTDASSGKVRIQSTRSIADMRIATSLITPSSSDSTFANSVFSEDNDSLSPGVGLSPTTATTTVATAPTNLSEPTTVTTTIANGDNSWDRDDDDDDDCGALAFQEGQQRQRIKASIRDSLILPLSIQMSRYSKQQLRKRLTIKRVTREFPEGIMVDPSLVLCMPSAVDLRAFIMGEDDNGALSKAIMASETRAAVIAISGYQPIDEQDELPPYSPPATQPELLAADKAKTAVDDGASAAQQQELGPGDPKELASVTTTEASLSGSNHRRRGRGSGRRRRNGDSDVGNLEKVKDLVSPTTTDTSDAKHQYRHRKGGSSCHHQHRETAADSLYAASTNRSHTSSSSGRQHLCHSIVSTTSNGSKLSHDGSSKSKPKPQAFEPVSKELRKSMHKQLPSIPPPSPSQPSPPPIGTKSSSSAKEHTQLSPTLKNATATCSSSSCPSEASLLPKRAASHGANDARHKVRTKGLVSPPASNAISDASVIGRPASSRSAASSDRGEVKPSKFSLLSSLTGKLKLWAP